MTISRCSIGGGMGSIVEMFTGAMDAEEEE
jgi:hypothetical protein